MIALKKDFHHGLVRLKINLLDDLWYLSYLIEPGDMVTAKTQRKIKIGDGSHENTRVTKKIVMVKLLVESVDFSDSVDQLRVKGLVQEGPEEIPKGVYHSFGFKIGDVLTLSKHSWPSFLKQKLGEALANDEQKFLFVVFDREQAFFSLVQQKGIEHLASLSAQSQKKQYSTVSTDLIYKEIAKQLDAYVRAHDPNHIIAACPLFWKKNLESVLSDQLLKKVLFLSVSTVDKSIVPQLLTRPELQSLLKTQRVHQEERFLAELLKRLAKDEVAYGVDDVRAAAHAGAVEHIAVSESFINKSRSNNSYDVVDDLLKLVDSAKGTVHILSIPQVLKTIDGLGGIVAILRWQQK